MSEQAGDLVNLHRVVSLEFIQNSGGYAVRAIKGQKEPSKGWNPKTNDKARSDALIEQLKASDDNVGIHLHGALVDVDVDSDAPALMAALERFLPACGHVWGRRSRPRTHRVYVVRGGEFEPSQYPFLNTLKRVPEAALELRGGGPGRGEYSIMPGSVHPDGETYEWADVHRARNSPAVVDVIVLLRAVRLACAIAVLAPYWVEGLRNGLTMALSGFLHRAYSLCDEPDDPSTFALDEGAALAFLEALIEICGDDSSDRVARIKTFKMTWSKANKGEPVTGANTIGELTGDDKIVAKLYALLSESPDAYKLDAFLSRFVIWQGPGVVVDSDTLSAGEKVIMSRQNFVNSYGHEFVTISTGKRRQIADALFHMKTTTRIAGLTFEPGETKYVETRTGRKLNQWGGFAIPPHDEPVAKEDVQVFLSYLFNVVSNKDEKAYLWVVSWLANLFQHPGRRPGTTLVVVGKPGSGKSVLGNAVIVPIIGNHHAASTDSVEAVCSNFNVSFANKLFIQCDEATSNRQKRTSAKMKSMITDPEIRIEPKGVDAYRLPNHSRFYFTSNEEETAVFIGDGVEDRRYTVLRVSDARKDDLEYWTTFHDWCDSVNLAKVHRYFLDFQYDPQLIRRPYATEAKQQMQRDAWDPMDAWLQRWLARGHPLDERTHQFWHDAPIGTSKNIDRSAWPSHVSRTALSNDFALFQRQYDRNGPSINESHIGVFFNKIGLPLENDTRLKVKDWDDRKQCNVYKRVRVSEIPAPTEIRAYLDSKYGPSGAEHYDIEEETEETPEAEIQDDDSSDEEF